MDTEALESDGIELDLIEQMQQLAVKEDKKLEEPNASKADVFSQEVLSTKVYLTIIYTLQVYKKEYIPNI